MLKYIAALLALIFFVFALFYYAMRPAGAAVLRVTNTVVTNGGYQVFGELVNVSALPVKVRETNGAPEFALNIQAGVGAFMATRMLGGPHTFQLAPGATQTFSMLVETNADCVIYTDYITSKTFRRNLRSGIQWLATGGGPTGTPLEGASVYVRNPITKQEPQLQLASPPPPPAKKPTTE
ncbi:MAG TPA: hypothetical protein VEH27_10640 [Methylomirabilota bacterium]|nr:hypothetical protein [Methylomirabilota bacterium]